MVCERKPSGKSNIAVVVVVVVVVIVIIVVIVVVVVVVVVIVVVVIVVVVISFSVLLQAGQCLKEGDVCANGIGICNRVNGNMQCTCQQGFKFDGERCVGELRFEYKMFE